MQIFVFNKREEIVPAKRQVLWPTLSKLNIVLTLNANKRRVATINKGRIKPCWHYALESVFALWPHDDSVVLVGTEGMLLRMAKPK